MSYSYEALNAEVRINCLKIHDEAVIAVSDVCFINEVIALAMSMSNRLKMYKEELSKEIKIFSEKSVFPDTLWHNNNHVSSISVWSINTSRRGPENQYRKIHTVKKWDM